MSTRLAQIVGLLQPVLAMTASRRLHVHRVVHAIRGHQRAPVPGMSRLAAPRAAALLPASAQTWLARQPIRRGWLRGGGGILLAQRELPLQLRDLSRLVGHLPRLLSQLAIAFDQVSTQPLILTSKLVDFLRRAPLGHVSDGTPIRRSVQGPLNCYAIDL
jgi:hypothetical protein